MSDYTDRRISPRHHIEVPVQFERGRGVSRDISFTGIYFVTEEALLPGESLRLGFELNYAIPGKSLQLDCHGRVLRVEQLDGRYGIAAQIDEVVYLH